MARSTTTPQQPIDPTGTLRDLDRRRVAMVRARTWPEHSVEMWLKLAGPARARYEAGHAPTPLEAKALAVADAVNAGPKPYRHAEQRARRAG